MQRDVPTKFWEAGVDMTNLRQHIDEKYPVKCRDIRAREPKGKLVNWDRTIITVMEYDASGGKEFFISAEDAEMISSLDFAGYAFLPAPSEQKLRRKARW